MSTRPNLLGAILVVGGVAIALNFHILPSQGGLYPLASATAALPRSPVSEIDSVAVLTEINRLRRDPAAYADWLESIRPYFSNEVLSWPGEVRLQTQEGVEALDEAIFDLRQMPPLPPLLLSEGMSQAAADHTRDLIRTDHLSIRGSDGSSTEERLRRYGTPEGSVQGLLTQGLQDPRAIVANLVIDDGNLGRSYRQALLSATFQYAGVSCALDDQLSLCVLNLAAVYREAAEAAAIADSPVESSINESRAVSSSSSGETRQQSATGESNPFTEPLTTAVLTEIAADIVAETNLLRADPATYADKLEALRSYYEGRLLKIPGQPAVETVEGVAALEEAIAALNSTGAVATLTSVDGLTQGAADHANDIGPRGMVGHSGTDGSSPLQRVQRYGTIPPGNRLGENITYGPPTLAAWHVIQLVVDDNVPDRGHRKALLRRDYRFTGVACAPHTVFRIVCVATYASDYTE